MEAIIKPLLLIDGITLTRLIEDYRLFFISLLPSIFLVAVIIEYFDRLEPFSLLKRTFISILILTNVTTIYTSTIDASFKVADQKLQEQRYKNVFLLDMLDANKHLNKLQNEENKSFYKNNNLLIGTFAFIKHHMFDSFINDSFTVTTYFIAQLCFIILKAVYSLVYYLGIGLIGIPCLIYLLPSMGNVLRGGIITYIWCLVIPHILVFVLTVIGTEINQGYSSGSIIGGSLTGTAFLFLLTLFIAFTPLIGTFILAGSGIAQAGGIIASIGANWIMNLPRKSFDTSFNMATGGPIGHKALLTKNALKSGYNFAKKVKINPRNFNFAKKKSFSNPKSGDFTKPNFLGSTKISGQIPKHTSSSDYSNINNKANKSGVDFISVPTKNHSDYNADQKLNHYSTPTHYTKRRSANGKLSKSRKVYGKSEKTSNTSINSRNPRSPYNFRSRNFSKSSQRS